MMTDATLKTQVRNAQAARLGMDRAERAPGAWARMALHHAFDIAERDSARFVVQYVLRDEG